MANLNAKVPFSVHELDMLDHAMQKITKQSLNDWLTQDLTEIMNNKLINFNNPFVQNWKVARPTIKYFENRNSFTYPDSTLTLKFKDVKNQNFLDEINEIIDDHHLNFWNFDRLTTFLLLQLLSGTEDHFSIPVTKDYNLPFSQSQNWILRQHML